MAVLLASCSFQHRIISASRALSTISVVGSPKGYANINKIYVPSTGSRSSLPADLRNFKVLGIESSCDDTGVGIVDSNGNVLANKVYSQHQMHEKFGGIIPGVAKMSHENNIDKAIEEALRESGVSSINDIDGIAATRGPGLEICLRVGYRKAQELSRLYSKPFVDIHHLEAHMLLTRMATNSESEGRLEFPFLTILVSGGHTSILLCNSLGNYTMLGATLDDSLGECFDKIARLLGLKASATSGGAMIEGMASQGKVLKESFSGLQLRAPMWDIDSCDFSFSGFKTSFRREVLAARKKCGLPVDSTNAPTTSNTAVETVVALPDDITADLCATFQHYAFLHVEDRLMRALEYADRKGIALNGIAVVGGVAANVELRRRLGRLLEQRSMLLDALAPVLQASDEAHLLLNRNVGLVFPPVALCTDNGVMVAWSGVEKFREGISDSNEEVVDDVFARWPLGQVLKEADSFKKNKLFRRVKST